MSLLRNATGCNTEDILLLSRQGYHARARALEELWKSPNCGKELSKAYIDGSEELFAAPNFLDLLQVNSSPVQAKGDREDCQVLEITNNFNSLWDDCCSLVPPMSSPSTKREDCPVQFPCCNFSIESSAYLRLPALREPAIKIVSLGGSTVMELEQDGYLRPYDVAGILWPSGYLLSQCLVDPVACMLPELDKLDSIKALELGCGIGAPSIALAMYMKEVHREGVIVATDIAPHALALTLTNARSNNVSVITQQLDFTKKSSELDSLGNEFTVVFGSSLQKGFQNTKDPACPLWQVLDTLLTEENCFGIFVHTREDPLEPPLDGSFELLRRISGDVFGMATRDGEASDFELSLFRRQAIIKTTPEL